jgi:hypothetical protein
MAAPDKVNGSTPSLQVEPDGTTVAYFDENMEMVNRDDPSARYAHIHKPDGTSIWGVKGPPEAPPTKQ